MSAEKRKKSRENKRSSDQSPESIKEAVRRRRDREQALTAIRARQFTGLQTLKMGLELSALAAKIAGARGRE